MAGALRFTKYLSGRSKGRVLVSYLKDPAWEELRGKETAQFSNNGAGRTWPKVLNKQGYVVDVINWDDTDFIPLRQYDIIIIHGGKNFKQLVPALKPDGKLIYYSTGSYWRFHNEQEEARFSAFEKRNKYKLAHDRYIGDDEEMANQQAHAIISLGNDATAKTYKDFPSVYHLEGASYPGTPSIARNMTTARQHFLFLSGPGNIHKGLDIALEAFRKTPELHLHIMGVLNKDFEEFYHDDLYKSANIHTYGFVPQRSTLFYTAVRQCAYSLLLSCSEGSPGSVIESLQHGMVPIITPTSHIDIPTSGIEVTTIDPEVVAKVLRKAATMDPKTLAEHSQDMITHTKRNFSLNRFERELGEIIKTIVEDK